MIKLQGPSTIINGDENLAVSRVGQTIYPEGKPVQVGNLKFNITCTVQPLNGRDLLLVPEGDRFKEQYYLFANGLQKVLEISDRVIRQSVNYEVQSLENWGSYQRARIVRIDAGPNATP